MKVLRICTALAAMAVSASTALANDSTASLGAGGLILTESADIRMASEDLFVSRTAIRVKYSFVNESGAPITTRVAFPLPVADLQQLAESDVGWPTQNAKNIVDFKVKVDGKPVKWQLEEKAFLNNADVSDVLRRFHIPFGYTAWDAAEAVKKLSPAAKQELKTRGLIDMSDDYVEVKWTVKNTFHWQQTFPANRPLAVEHSYKPVVGGSFFPAHAFFENPQSFRNDEYLKQFCVDDTTYNAIGSKLRALQKRKGDGAMLLSHYVEYVLTTGKNWKGPIGQFRLTLDKGRASSLISFCLDGVKKTGPTTFVVERRDFEPEQDLNVLLIDEPQD